MHLRENRKSSPVMYTEEAQPTFSTFFVFHLDIAKVYKFTLVCYVSILMICKPV